MSVFSLNEQLYSVASHFASSETDATRLAEQALSVGMDQPDRLMNRKEIFVLVHELAKAHLLAARQIMPSDVALPPAE